MWFLFVFRAVIAMAQVQLNSPPPPQHEATSCSETSQLDESRPPDPSFSLRSDEQPPVSVETRTLNPSFSATLCDEQLSLSPTRATGCLYDNMRLPSGPHYC